jgi:hypothetical protein
LWWYKKIKKNYDTGNQKYTFFIDDGCPNGLSISSMKGKEKFLFLPVLFQHKLELAKK